MSMHDFGLLSASASHDHFPSAFMQGYHHHPQSFDHERYTPSSTISSQPPIERYIHPMQGEVLPSGREPFLPHDRRLSDPHPRATYLPRQPLNPSSFAHGFDYAHHNQLPHSTLLQAHRGSPSSAQHNPNVRSLVGFDPRPPHAGWTPKEEVDEDEQTRELLAGGVSSEGRSPAGSHLSVLQSPTEPRDESDSPGNTANSPSAASKTYSFVSLPGNAVRKRPRRRYDEIERLYACSWPDCTKAYGTLNHLNAHVSMQRHGAKRSPAEFKELRKQWRQQKKQESTQVNPAGVPGTPRGATRRRRGTEPALSLSVPGDVDFEQGMASHHTHPHPSHRLSLGDLRYPAPSDDEGNVLGPSPTSTASDSVAYWQDSPISPPMESAHHIHPQSRSGLHYTVPIPHPSSPLPSSNVGGLSPPLSRLPPDSTLLTPLPGYRPPSPPISRLEPGSTLLQPLHPSTLASLPPVSPPQQQRSPHNPRVYEYEDRRPA